MQPCEAVLVLDQSLLVLFLMVDVSEHDRRSAQTDLSVLAVGNFLGCSRLADLVVGVGVGKSDGTFLLLVVRGETACCDALCRSVSLSDSDCCTVVCEELVQFLLELDGQAVSAGENSHQAGKVDVVHLLVPCDSLVQGWDTGDVVRLCRLEELGVALDADLRDQNASSAPEHQGVYTDTQTESVEHGHCRKHCHSLDLLVAHRTCLKCKCVEVEVGQLDAFCDSCRSAGEEDDCEVLSFLNYGRICGALLGLAKESLPCDEF